MRLGHYSIRVNRWVEASKVRDMCIRYGYYTKGDNYAYSNMLKTADNMNADDTYGVYDIAVDIYNHSNLAPGMDYTENDLIEGIMYGIYNECVETSVEIC